MSTHSLRMFGKVYSSILVMAKQPFYGWNFVCASESLHGTVRGLKEKRMIIIKVIGLIILGINLVSTAVIVVAFIIEANRRL